MCCIIYYEKKFQLSHAETGFIMLLHQNSFIKIDSDFKTFETLNYIAVCNKVLLIFFSSLGILLIVSIYYLKKFCGQIYLDNKKIPI